MNEFGLATSKSASTTSVIGPDGKIMTLADLPPADTKRWVVRRKAVVVFAVRAGLLTLEEACEYYSLSIEEFMSWQRLIENHGMRGLRTTGFSNTANRNCAGAADALDHAPPSLLRHTRCSPLPQNGQNSKPE